MLGVFRGNAENGHDDIVVLREQRRGRAMVSGKVGVDRQRDVHRQLRIVNDAADRVLERCVEVPLLQLWVLGKLSRVHDRSDRDLKRPQARHHFVDSASRAPFGERSVELLDRRGDQLQALPRSGAPAVPPRRRLPGGPTGTPVPGEPGDGGPHRVRPADDRRAVGRRPSSPRSPGSGSRGRARADRRAVPGAVASAPS